ncbi:MAG: putative porin [Muribaculaceae bacterium]|nr:putative porin [Muribaculaceae bacterium]
MTFKKRCIAVVLIMTLLSSFALFAQQNSDEQIEEKRTYPPGSAWTLSWPLGTHIESTLDTLLYNYQRSFVSALGSDAWATTGQFTGPAINMIYFKRPQEREFYFDNSISYWLPSFSKQKFYNMYIPFTQLSYGWGYGTDNRTDHLSATFAGNVNRKIGIGAWIEYPYTKGSYSQQATKGLGYGFSGYYAGDRYEMQAFFNHSNHVNKESGGIQNDLYITDPAELQGGVNTIEPKSIPVNLTGAQNRLIGMEFYMNHAYKLGFWKDITQPGDTIEKEEFVPVTKFVYSLDWKRMSRNFINTNSTEGQKFWENTYFDTAGTEEDDYYWSVDNTIGIELMEGFQKWAKFGLSAYATYRIDKYNYDVVGMTERAEMTPEQIEGLPPLPAGWQGSRSGKRNRLWVGGRIEKTRGSIIRYAADAKFGLIGDVIGDIDISGGITTQFRLAHDTVRINAEGGFSNLEPNYMLNHYVGNHFIWNNDFSKIQKYRVGGKLHIPWTRTELSVNLENIGNYIYFDSTCTPRQHSGNVQVFSATLDQKLKFGIWNWDNTFTYQATSNSDILPLPAFALYSNMYLYFHVFRALTVQIGVDCNWYTKYRGLGYQPATMTFHTQGENPIDVGGFIFSDVYLTVKLYKVRFFLMCSHLNEGWFSKDFFSLPHYPLDPRQFRLGLSIDFAN